MVGWAALSLIQSLGQMFHLRREGTDTLENDEVRHDGGFACLQYGFGGNLSLCLSHF